MQIDIADLPCVLNNACTPSTLLAPKYNTDEKSEFQGQEIANLPKRCLHKPPQRSVWDV